jgi:outer membrane immunogenic protein
MKNVRKQLLASAATVVALGGTAYAADMGLPMKAPPAPAPIPYTNWQGFYIGGLVGAARLNETATQTSNPFNGGVGNEFSHAPCAANYNVASCSTAATGAVAGVEVGYDWQSRYFVYGLAADWTWTGLKHTVSNTASGTTVWSQTAKVEWLASFRGRMGLAVDDTMVYFTGGLALGGVKSSATTVGFDTTIDWGSLNKVAVGWVAGLGVEHKFNQNWSVKAEALYYDLGRSSASGTTHSGAAYTTEFTHEVIVGRVGLAYHF